MKRKILNLALTLLIFVAIVTAAFVSSSGTATAKQTTTTYEKVCEPTGVCYIYVYEDGVLVSVYPQ